MNKILLVGRMVKDPDLRYTQSGTAVANATIAVQRKFKNNNGEYEADFINIQAWQKTAEFLANYFKKGQQIAIEGRIQVRNYDKDGEKRWVTEIIAEQLEFVGSKKDSSGSSSSNSGSSDNTGGGRDNDLMLGEEINFSESELPF